MPCARNSHTSGSSPSTTITSVSSVGDPRKHASCRTRSTWESPRVSSSSSSGCMSCLDWREIRWIKRRLCLSSRSIRETTRCVLLGGHETFTCVNELQTCMGHLHLVRLLQCGSRCRYGCSSAAAALSLRPDSKTTRLLTRSIASTSACGRISGQGLLGYCRKFILPQSGKVAASYTVVRQ